MSDPLRIALVAEGPTDGVVIEAVIRSMLAQRPFVLTQIFPDMSVGFGLLGTGWVGVYRWCHQSARNGGGRLSGDPLVFGIGNFDLLIVHLDADVAGSDYTQGSIVPQPTDGSLPCEQPCPPPSNTTDALRAILLSWCGETNIPPRTVLCTPSKSTEAWVVAALFPHDQAIADGIECFAKPESRLAQQPKAARLRKKKHDYQVRSGNLEQAWPRLTAAGALTEAKRFEAEFLASVSAI